MTKTIIKALKQDFIIENKIVDISCSVGVAIFPDDGNTTDTLITTADKGMYQSK